MSQLIDDAAKRKEVIKHMILQLHQGTAPEAVKKQLIRLMGEVPYSDIVEVEQQLIAEGLPQGEILKLCDIHTAAMKGIIDTKDAKTAPAGHPVHTFTQENIALSYELDFLNKLFAEVNSLNEDDDAGEIFINIRVRFNNLMDIEKHYQRKENLIFPFLEKHGVTGPPQVMWGKHNETRELFKNANEALGQTESITAGEGKTVIDLVLKPAVTAVDEMIYKEREILFPMCLDTLTDDEWFEVYNQSIEIGFCLYDPQDIWIPAGMGNIKKPSEIDGRIRFPSGSLTQKELLLILNTIPFDMTFIDKDDNVRYFTQGKERIFARTRAIIGRKVQNCHPPSSVHLVQKILDDFHQGRQSQAAFWITLKDRFIHIEYYALRDEKGEYAGTLEVSQDLTEKRNLQGEQRLLEYS